MCLAGLYKNGQLVEHPDCKPWVEDNFWEIKRSNNAIVEEAYKQFNGKISCANRVGCCLWSVGFMLENIKYKKVTWFPFFVLFSNKTFNATFYSLFFLYLARTYLF